MIRWPRRVLTGHALEGVGADGLVIILGPVVEPLGVVGDIGADERVLSGVDGRLGPQAAASQDCVFQDARSKFVPVDNWIIHDLVYPVLALNIRRDLRRIKCAQCGFFLCARDRVEYPFYLST